MLMSCDQIQKSLALYFDDGLTAEARATCDQHLDVCPVCRARLSEMRSITRSLGMLSAPAVPLNLVASVNQALVAESAARKRRAQATFSDWVLVWMQPRAMQYGFSFVASVILFAAVFLALRPHMIALHEAAQSVDVAIAVKDGGGSGYDINQPISPESYAALRAPYNSQSPSLNPGGALALLALSGNRDNGRHDDMIVVADVYANGVASLADVMQAPRDGRVLEEFQKALSQNAAFVPASVDGRPETMRVVFSVQRVDVRDRGF